VEVDGDMEGDALSAEEEAEEAVEVEAEADGRRLQFAATRHAYSMRRYNYSALYRRYNFTSSSASRKRVVKQVIKSHAHEREETLLMKKVDRLRRKYVALVSEVTHGFVTVERPPHGDALQAVALTDKLSLQSIFALLPSGHIAALGTNALLNVCDPKSPVSTATANAPINSVESLNSVAQTNRPPPPPAAASGPTLCTGYRAKPNDPHYRLLRITTSRASEFSITKH